MILLSNKTWIHTLNSGIFWYMDIRIHDFIAKWNMNLFSRFKYFCLYKDSEFMILLPNETLMHSLKICYHLIVIILVVVLSAVNDLPIGGQLGSQSRFFSIVLYKFFDFFLQHFFNSELTTWLKMTNSSNK